MLVTESLDLERQLLFLCFRHQDKFQKVTSDLNDSSFSNNVHRKIFNFLSRTLTEGKTCSIQACSTILQTESSDDVEKMSIRSAVDTIISSTAKLEDHEVISDQLKRFETTRKFLKSIRKTTETLGDSETLEEGLNNLEKNIQKYRNRLTKVSDLSHMTLKGDVDKRIEYSKMVKTTPELAGLVQTGFRNFDKFLPAIPQGNFYLYQARPSVGKSMFLMGTALHNYAHMGNKVVYITIEMSAREVLFRMDSNITGFDQKDFVTGKITEDPDNIEIWKQKVSRFGTGKNTGDIEVFWIPENCTPAKIKALLSSLPYKPDLVIVDYAGDMDCDDPRLSKYDPKAQALVYDALKSIAQIFECVLFSAQQIKRGEGKKVTSESGYGSDKGSQRADGLIHLFRSEEDMALETETEDSISKGRLTAEYIKNRGGVLLATHLIPLFYKMNWIEVEMDEPEYASSAPASRRKNKPKKRPEDITGFKKPEDVKGLSEIIPLEGELPSGVSATPKVDFLDAVLV